MVNEDKVDSLLKQITPKDDLSVPVLVWDRIDQTLSALPQKRIFAGKRHFLAIAAAALLCLLFGLGFVSPVVAGVLKHIPLIGSIFSTYGDLGIAVAEKQGYTIRVDKTSEDQGIKFTIREVLWDGVRFSIGFLQESSAGLQEFKGNVDMDVFVDGEPLNYTSSDVTGKVLNGTDFAGVMNIYPDEKLPDKFSLKLMIGRIGTVEGKWNLEFPVTKAVGKPEELVFSPGTTKEWNDIKLTVRNVTFAPSATKLQIEICLPPGESRWMNFGRFYVFDNKGMMLQPFGGSGGSETVNGREAMIYSSNFAPVSDIPEHLIIKPIIDEENKTLGPPKEVTASLTGRFPVTLSQGEAGTLTVTGVDYLKDKTRIYFEVQGAEPFAQAYLLWTRDNSGQDYNKNAPDASKPVRVRNDRYAFYQDFPPYKKGAFQVVTKQFEVPTVLNELAVKVPLAR